MTPEKLPTIGMLWIGGSLRWLEQLCIQSFLDMGHEVVLFCYDKVANIPAGVTIADANEIYPSEEFILHARTGSPAIHADVFRLHLMKKTDYIWADTDAYCLRPWHLPASGHFHAPIEGGNALIANGVLRLPKDSEALDLMIEFFKDEYPIPPWFPEKRQQMLRDMKARGEGQHISILPWGVSGPNLLTHFLGVTDEARYSLPFHVLYPLPYSLTHWFFRAIRRDQKERIEQLLLPDTVSIHFYGRRFRDVARNFDGVPEPNSFIGERLTEHGIDWTTTSYQMAGHFEHNVKRIEPLPGVDLTSVPETACAQLAFDEMLLPKTIRPQWRKGNTEPLMSYVAERKEIILHRALQRGRKRAESFVEALDSLAPKRLASIGSCCGFVELHLHRRFNCHLTLIEDAVSREDQVTSPFTAVEAKAFLVANGVPADQVTVLRFDETEAAKSTPFDALLAFAQIGRQRAPVMRLDTWITKTLRPGGVFVTDVRAQSGAYPYLQKLGKTQTLCSEENIATVATWIGSPAQTEAN